MYALTAAVSDLLGYPVPERSVNAMIHCPFHEDRTPSFSIHLDEGVWHCFSCQESGTLKGLYRRLGTDVDPSIRLIQAKRDAEEPIVTSRNFASQANGFIRDLRQGNGDDFYRRFCTDRGIVAERVERYHVGYNDERDALAFSYADQDGRVTGIKYRKRDGFKFSEPGSVYGLFGLSDVLGKSDIVVCEGESDTLRVKTEVGDRYGVCGTSGASVSATQWSRFGLHFLFARRIYLLYDGDSAGDACAEAAMSVLGDTKCVQLRPPDGEDATSYLQQGLALEHLGLGD